MNKATDNSRFDPQDGDAQLSPERRQFLKTASKLAVTAPAVTLLLAANAMPGQAYAMYTREEDSDENKDLLKNENKKPKKDK